MSGKAARSAREQARAMAPKRKGQKKNTTALKWGIPLTAILGVCVYGFIASNAAATEFPAAGPVPGAGNAFGGISAQAAPAAASLTVDTNKIPAAEKTGAPAGIAPAKKGQPAQVVIYADMNCVHCGEFDANYGAALKQMDDEGKISLETRMVAFLDAASPSNYSSRAANAGACVADHAPEKYLDFNTAVWATHDSGELKNQQLIDTAAKLGVTGIDSCVTDGTYRPYVKLTTAAATEHGVTGTPSIFINGEQWDLKGDFLQVLQDAVAS